MTTGGLAAAVERVAPLSPGQERLLAEYSGENQPWPNSNSAVRLRPIDVAAILVEGPLNLTSMGRAVDALVERQTALRTTFRFRRDAPPIQVVLASRPCRMAVGHLPGGSLEPPPLESVAAAAQRPALSPTDPDLFLAQVLKVAPERHVVLLHIHHLISDGWAIGLLYRELSAFYEAMIDGDLPLLPRLSCTFGEYCIWLKAERSSPRLVGQLRYWQSELAGPLPAIPFTTATHDGDSTQAPVNDEALHFKRGLVERLRAAARSADVPGGLAGAMLTALAVAINARTGASDIRIGTMASGRTRKEAEHLIGNLVNIVTIRIQIEPDKPLGNLLSLVNGKVAAALDHQDVPIQDVRRALSHAPQAEYAEPLYQITFALNTMRVGSLALPGLECRDLGFSASGESTGPRTSPTSVALRWVLVESRGDLRGSVTYDMRCFKKREVRSLVEDFERTLRAIATGSQLSAGS